MQSGRKLGWLKKMEGEATERKVSCWMQMDFFDEAQTKWDCWSIQGKIDGKGIRPDIWNWLLEDVCTSCEDEYYESFTVSCWKCNLASPPTWY